MSDIGKNHPKEYSDLFDQLRQNRVEFSMYKYGSAATNFGDRLVNALESHEMCIKKYQKTGNTEYLCDAANYLMFEFMYPQMEEAYFQSTDSSGSAGISGKAIKQYEEEENRKYSRFMN